MAFCTLAKRSSVPFMRASSAAVLSDTASRHVVSGCAEKERGRMISHVRFAIIRVLLQKRDEESKA